MFDRIIGQEHAKNVLGSMLRSNKLPHSLLFAGPYGVGKGETAFELARMLLCLKGPVSGCTACHSCRRAAKLEHPDLHILFPFRDAPKGSEERTAWTDEFINHRKLLSEEPYAPIIYEKARQIVKGLVADVQEKLLESSFEGGPKVCVILCADRLNPTTANSLLKILEEPPPGVYFIMTTERVSSVRPTIVSRSSVVRFRRLKFQEIQAYLDASGELEPVKTASYAETAGGSLKTANALAYENKTASLERSFALFKSVIEAETDDVIGHAAQFVWSRDLAEAEELINGFALCTKEVLKRSLGVQTGMAVVSNVPESLSFSISLSSLHYLSARLEEGLEMLGRNVNIPVVMWSVLHGIHTTFRD